MFFRSELNTICNSASKTEKVMVFIARWYCVCVCVRLSQVGVLLKRLNESGWFLARELHSTYPTLCYKEIHVPLKIRVLPSGILI